MIQHNYNVKTTWEKEWWNSSQLLSVYLVGWFYDTVFAGAFKNVHIYHICSQMLWLGGNNRLIIALLRGIVVRWMHDGIICVCTLIKLSFTNGWCWIVWIYAQLWCYFEVCFREIVLNCRVHLPAWFLRLLSLKICRQSCEINRFNTEHLWRRVCGSWGRNVIVGKFYI